MRVAFLSFDFGEYCIRLASALTRQAEVLLLLPQQEAGPHLSKLGQSVRFQPFHKPRLRQPFRQIGMILTLLRWIKHFGPDVIHVQQGHLWFNGVLPLVGRYGLVVTIHDVRHHLGDRGAQNTPQAVFDFGFRRADQVIVHAEALKRTVIDVLGVRDEIVHVIPHVVLGDATVQSTVCEQDNVILFFGRIWEYKGLEYLIRAEPFITAEVPDAKIIIAGEGEDFAAYRRMMVHPDHFIVHNEYVSDEKRAELFQQASVVVLPYTEASQSGVIPVAYTFSKPVVVTNVGGLPEMVENGRTGYLVPPRDERCLADAVLRLLRDTELRRQMGANGKQKIDTECSPEAVADRTLEVYHVARKTRQLATRILGI